jgi:DNA-binding NarL/FixJ family response regulator
MTTTAADEIIRIVIVDDHEVVALGLKALLSDEVDFEVVGTATTVVKAQAVVAETQPNVVLVDSRLPDGSGIDVVSALRATAEPPGVVMVTAAADKRVLSQALDAGCLGFLSKNADHADLVASVRAAAKGESHFTPDVVRHLSNLRRFEQFDTDELSQRECEVLQLSAVGKSPEEIASELFLSLHTVRNHIRNSMTKLQAHSKLEAVVKAARLRIITLDDD